MGVLELVTLIRLRIDLSSDVVETLAMTYEMDSLRPDTGAGPYGCRAKIDFLAS